MHGIEKDRKQTWRIKRVFTRMSQRFAVRYVLYPAAATKRHDGEMQHHLIVRMVHRLHDMWFRRVKELLSNQLWKPGDVDATVQTDLWTFRRVMNCRPSCVVFRGGNRNLIRPCAQYKFCPFCWGRAAAFLYRRFKGRILRAKTQQRGLVLYCRVSSHFVVADGFNEATGMSAEHILVNIRTLKDIFEQHQAAYKKINKELQRKTVGSAWRLVADPADKGWTIEIRQLALTKPTRRLPPFVKFPGVTKVFDASVKVHDDEKVYELLGRFMEYPSGLMTSYAELTAVYLQAAYRLRLTSGTGLFRTCGGDLVRAFREENSNGEKNRKHQEEYERAVGQHPPQN